MDDLIPRLRALMAELEARLQQGDVLHDDDVSPKLKQALSTPAVRADVGAETDTTFNLPDQSMGYDLSMADIRSATRETKPRPTDYVPTHHDFDPDDFIGTGDSDPLGHEDLIRGRR